MMAEQAQLITLGLTRKSLHAMLIHACPHCGAPGVYKADAVMRQKWPGCYSEVMSGRPVGSICPNCGRRRSADRNLGELCASMPLWIWNTVLALKWLTLKLLALFPRA